MSEKKKKPAAKKKTKQAEQTPELSDRDLNEVVGGAARDVATGVASGTRMHKPLLVLESNS